MAVKIYGSNFLSGMPSMDYRIDIDGAGISLDAENFRQLVESLGEKMVEDHKGALAAKEKNTKNIQKLQELRKDIINVFWEGDQDDIDSFFFKRDVKDIDQEKLWEVLQKHNRFLGFE